MNAMTPPAGSGNPLSPSETVRPSAIQLVFREKGALYAAYMPFLKGGGLFVPTAREYHLGDAVYLLVSLPNDAQRYPVAGQVAWITPANASGARVGQLAWITPANASGARVQGVGVAFPFDEKTQNLRTKIEAILGDAISSKNSTQTI